MRKETIFNTKDNFELHGLLETPDNSSDKCVILCHGLLVDMEELGVYTKFVPMLINNGYHVFRFDFRGHGKSAKKEGLEYTVTRSLNDLRAAISYLKEQGYKSFFIVAASFSGGAVSMYGGSNPEGLKGLIMWNALIDYEEKINPTTERNIKAYGQAAVDEIAKNGFIQKGQDFKLSKEAFEELYKLKPYKELLKFKKPVLFIHGDKDQYVPYENSVKYSGMMNNAKLVTIKGAPHGFQIEEDGDKAREVAIKFIRENFS